MGEELTYKYMVSIKFSVSFEIILFSEKHVHYHMLLEPDNECTTPAGLRSIGIMARNFLR